MVKVGGKTFRCDCGGNVLTIDPEDDDLFTCNSCQTQYRGDRSETDSEPNPSPAVAPVLPPYIASALERSRWHREQAVVLRRQAVRQLKTAGWTWTAIGRSLNVSRQRAEQIGRGSTPYTPRPVRELPPIEF